MIAMIALNVFAGCLGMAWGNKFLASVNFTVAASLFALELAK